MSSSNHRIGPGDGVRAVVGAYVCDARGRLLFLRRAPGEFLAGNWEIPSGGVEEGETLEAAVARELHEETGLRLREISGFVASRDYDDAEGVTARQFNYAVAIPEVLEIVLSPEHDEFAFVGEEAIGSFRLDRFGRTLAEDYFAWRARNGK